jgi:hypothetical protein
VALLLLLLLLPPTPSPPPLPPLLILSTNSFCVSSLTDVFARCQSRHVRYIRVIFFMANSINATRKHGHIFKKRGKLKGWGGSHFPSSSFTHLPAVAVSHKRWNEVVWVQSRPLSLPHYHARARQSFQEDGRILVKQRLHLVHRCFVKTLEMMMR